MAQLVLALCLVGSFAVPYGAVSLKEAYQDQEWLATGMNGAEIDDWKRENITVRMAVRWRNAGFKPPHAAIWIKGGFGSEPEEAGKWNDQEVRPNEARYWKEMGFSAEEGRAWKEHGFHYSEARDWKRGGIGPVTAAVRKKKGERPPR
jgi:hypothetical protein